MSQIKTYEKPSSTSRVRSTHIHDSHDIPQMQILKYMGNKRRILNWLIPILSSYLKDGDTFLDLFAGTSSVGYALKPKVRVLANDVQEYSSVMSTALLEFNGKVHRNDFKKYLSLAYNKNYSRLMSIFGKAIKVEEKILSSGNIKDYKEFCLNIPKYGEPVIHDKFKLNNYSREKFLQKKRASKTKFPYMLFITYYPNTFFGLKQCIEIDSIRYAVDQVKNKNKRALYLSCLIYATSRAVNSSGHFAEYLNHSSENASRMILDQRKVSVLSSFLSKLSKFTNLYIQHKWKNKVYCCEYKTLIKNLHKNNKIKEIDLIYIDPPYTNAQYSRFYHIPETLVKYDYPNITRDFSNHNFVKGMYRDDRYQSKFSNSGETEMAFIDLFRTISNETDAILAVSYSDNSILKPVDKLIDIAKKYYAIIDKKNGHTHSAQGSKFRLNGKGNREVHEYLLICKPKHK